MIVGPCGFDADEAAARAGELELPVPGGRGRRRQLLLAAGAATRRRRPPARPPPPPRTPPDPGLPAIPLGLPTAVDAPFANARLANE